MSALEFEGVHCGYADTTVVRSLSGSVGAGHVLGVLGRNGVGKSTLLKGLSGVLTPSAGRVVWQGRDVTRLALHQRRAYGMSYVPQENIVFGDLSVAENLYLHFAQKEPRRYDEIFRAFPLLAQRQAQRAGSLSGGERKLLSFARTLALQSDLTLLDEPTEGVQPENVQRMGELIRKRCREGACFVIVEQHLDWMLSIADRLLVMEHGEAVLRGTVADIDRATVERHLLV
ncbi:ATP-binding cassette domain-containing protein [Thiomonas sp. FB-6]|uniref:ATP-binding cassette domain-containing protein n=1 Tax=Thiomonas sp. FB-6 TaxID=1158291 RepID=UPI000476DB86|nr:ATP-binding cassette domain-containing protein [Thiomonas sp. FB-6]